jgi:hypothetical protein
MAWISRAGPALAAAFGAWALAGSVAYAGTPLPHDGMTLQEVQAWLTGLGLQSAVNTEHSLVAVRVNNQLVGVFVSDCQTSGRCRSLQYYYGITFPNGVKPDDASAAVFINGWNMRYRWVRAFVDQQRNPAMEMDFSLTPGVDSDALTTSMITFVGAMPLFSSYLNPQPQPEAQPPAQPQQQ